MLRMKGIVDRMINGNDHGKGRHNQGHVHSPHDHTKLQVAHAPRGNLNRFGKHDPVVERHITLVDNNGSEKYGITQHIREKIKRAQQFKGERRAWRILYSLIPLHYVEAAMEELRENQPKMNHNGDGVHMSKRLAVEIGYALHKAKDEERFLKLFRRIIHQYFN